MEVENRSKGSRLRKRRASSFMYTSLPKFWGPILLKRIRHVNFPKISSMPGFTHIYGIFQYKLEGSTNSIKNKIPNTSIEIFHLFIIHVTKKSCFAARLSQA